MHCLIPLPDLHSRDAYHCIIIISIHFCSAIFFSHSIANLSCSKSNSDLCNSPCCYKCSLRKSNFLASPSDFAEAKILTASIRTVDPLFFLGLDPLRPLPMLESVSGSSSSSISGKQYCFVPLIAEVGIDRFLNLLVSLTISGDFKLIFI
ncbi:hypothetical protein L873DRAFT_29879 [Choiromyces venosus 120613-1]|uniref:Uncharacterized protein n=1 Tax=Choiromyces venosus 120613-1 TaxID=1336337 RepID=A0A3N4K704_9PEZI|nr:hypothetical protein L873DRAFT_29879 [Choiromyces venosus 120613-1]